MRVCEVLPNLKHLKIGIHFETVNLLYLRNIVERCKNLESMDVVNEKIEEVMMPMRKGFKFCYHDLSSFRNVFNFNKLSLEYDNAVYREEFYLLEKYIQWNTYKTDRRRLL